jgi:hypothetical protein
VVEEQKVAVKELHLAAYMKSNGAQFTGFNGHKFTFMTHRDESDWRVAHSNSCCRRVDLELISLRKFLKG